MSEHSPERVTRTAYVPSITADRPLLSSGASGWGKPIHGWYERIPVRGRSAGRPIGSRSLCGKVSAAWCVEMDGLTVDVRNVEQSVREAESISWHGPMCPECHEALRRIRPENSGE